MVLYQVSHVPLSTTPLVPTYQIPTLTFETRKMADRYLTDQARLYFPRTSVDWNVLWSRIEDDGSQGHLKLYVWKTQWPGGPNGRMEGLWKVSEVEE